MKNRSNSLLVLPVFISSLMGFTIFSNLGNTITGVAGTNFNHVHLEVDYNYLELAEDTGQDVNASEPIIPLYSSSWNLTSIELNFSEIRMGKQEKVIEDKGSSFLFISKSYEGLSVELNVTEPMDLLGIEIYGNIIGSLISNVTVQVMGFDNATKAPNATTFGSPVLLNMSSTTGWHLQSFSSPIHLLPGSYSLVMDGSLYLPADNSQIIWYNNESNPLYPNLHISELDKGTWKDGETNKTLRHKLIQRVEEYYEPEDINMTVEFNSENHSVSNGSTPYSGNLLISNFNHAPGTDNVSLQIYVNNSVELLFNCSWNIQARKLSSSQASLTVKEDETIEWNIQTTINRKGYKYSIVLDKPVTWDDYTITRNGTNITSEVIFTTDNFTISDSSLIQDSIVNIEAFSADIDFDVSIPFTVYNPNQEIRFSATSPLEGNLTYYILNEGGIVEYHEDPRENVIGEEIFNVTVNENAPAGSRNIFVIWNNNTDAGVFVKEIKIEIPLTIDPMVVVMIFSISIASILGVLSAFQGVKILRKRREIRRRNVINKAKDLLNLNYLIVIEKRKGLDVYEQYFGGRELDSTIVTGFLEAIASFGIELTSSGKKTQTIKLEYQDLQILMSEFKHFRLTWIMKEAPSEAFLNAIESLSYDIEEKYGGLFQKFDGETTEFEGIGDLLEKNFNISFIFPLIIKEKEDVNLNQLERQIIEKAKRLIEENGTSFFYASLLFDKDELNARNLNSIFNLIQKGIFNPIEHASR